MSKIDEIVASIIDDTPAGEITNVINDLKLIVDKNISSELEESVAKYNVINFIPIQIPSKQTSVILTPYNKQSDGSFIDPIQGLQITVDHLKRKQTSVETIEKEDQYQEIFNELLNYVVNKFPNDVDVGLFTVENSLKIVVVGSRENPANFWNGRWVSEYSYDLKSEELTGDIKIDVHYYEDGNVRLKNTNSIEPTTVTKSSLIGKISELEDILQTRLNKSFLKLNETNFKNLRRQLPVTRSKINWGKSIGNYRLGKDVTNQ